MPPRATAAQKGKGKLSAAKAEQVRAFATRARAAPRSAQRVARLSLLSSASMGCLHVRAAPDARLIRAPPVPQSTQSKKTRTTVGADAALATTGPFKDLDAELHIRIFSLLSQEDLLRCLLEVCKGWRALRKDPALWRSLALCAPAFSGAGALAFLSGPRSPLPSPACVQELKIDGKQAFGAKTLEALLLALTHVTRISLQGRWLTPDVLTLLAAPRAAPLERLAVGGRVNNPDEMQAALADVFHSSPALTSLSVDMFVGVAWLYGLSRRAAAARGGARPVLRELRIMSGTSPWSYESGYECGMFAVALSRLGTVFPALITLAVTSLHGLDTLGQGPWAPMAALRSLRIANLELPWTARTTTSAQLSQLLGCIAAAAPHLESLDLSRGEEKLSPQDLRSGAQPTPLPSVGAGAGAGGVFALQQLRELKLSYVHVSAADCANAHLPSLRELHLYECGAHAAAAAVALAAAAPALESLWVFDVPAAELDGTAGPGVGALSALSHGALRTLRVFTGTAPFPRTARGAIGLKAAEGKAAKALAREMKALAARKALPALRTLALGAGYLQPLPPCFAASHPWPQLRSGGALPGAGQCPRLPGGPARARAHDAVAARHLVRRREREDALRHAADERRCRGVRGAAHERPRAQAHAAAHGGREVMKALLRGGADWTCSATRRSGTKLQAPACAAQCPPNERTNECAQVEPPHDNDERSTEKHASKPCADPAVAGQARPGAPCHCTSQTVGASCC